MAGLYIIENGAERGKWLYKIAGSLIQTYCYKEDISEALVFKKVEAVAFAKKWGARVWLVKGGEPVKQVFPK